MFRQRSYESELLDAEDIPRELLFQNLRELELVNKWLGGLAISLAGMKAALRPQEKMVLADIGCGGGDVLKACAQLARRKGIAAEFIGIDLKQDCIDYASRACAEFPEISFALGDYREQIAQRPEVTHIHASLFCHHLPDEEIVALFAFCKAQGKTLIVNDLQRHPLAYYSIWAITRLLGGSKLVRHDAPLSVLRSFRRQELADWLAQAGISRYTLRWRWAFRYLIIAEHAD